MDSDTLAEPLAAVLNDPSDDDARLAIARSLAWAGDRGRAELIRLQVPGENTARCRELVAATLTTWGPAEAFAHWHPTPLHLGSDVWRIQPGFEVEVTRGFVSTVQLTDPSDPDEAWTGATPAGVADRLSRLAAAVFLQHPVERFYLDFGEAETWEVVRKATGWVLRCGDRFEVETGSRPDLASLIRTHLGHRLLTLGEQVLADQLA